MSRQVAVGRHLVRTPSGGNGELAFRGTDISVRSVFDQLVRGATVDDLLLRYPQLQRSALDEALHRAADALLSPFEPAESPDRPFLPGDREPVGQVRE